MKSARRAINLTPKNMAFNVIDAFTSAAAAPTKKKAQEYTSRHHTQLETDAALEEHEERVSIVSARCEKNLLAAEELRKYMTSPRRNKPLRSPRKPQHGKPRGVSSKRTLNLSPCIATILPHSSKSTKQQIEYRDKNLLMAHNLNQAAAATATAPIYPKKGGLFS